MSDPGQEHTNATLDSLAAGLNKVATSLDSTLKTVESYALTVSELDKTVRRNRRAVVLVVIGLVLDVLLSVGLTVVAVRQAHNSSVVTAVQERTSNEVLCPLYQLFLDFEDRSTNSPVLSDEERKQRRESYVIIHHGYDALGCAASSPK